MCKQCSFLESHSHPIILCTDTEAGWRCQCSFFREAPGCTTVRLFPPILLDLFSSVLRLGGNSFWILFNIQMIMFLYETLFSLQRTNRWLVGNDRQAITFGCLSSFLSLIFNQVTHVLQIIALFMLQDRPLFSLSLAHLYYLLGMFQGKFPFRTHLCVYVKWLGLVSGGRGFWQTINVTSGLVKACATAVKM